MNSDETNSISGSGTGFKKSVGADKVDEISPNSTNENKLNKDLDFINNIFDKYSNDNNQLDSNSFKNLLSSDYLKHNDLIYLSKITSYINFDLFNLLYLINDPNNKGFITISDFQKFSVQFLLPNQFNNNTNNNNNIKNHNDLDLDIIKLLYFICQKFESNDNSNIDLNINSSLNKRSFLSLVKNYNNDDFNYINFLLTDLNLPNGNNINNNTTINFKQFIILMEELPKLKFNQLFNNFKNSNETISPLQLKLITQNIFYNKLSEKVSNHLELFAKHKYGNEINYNDAFKLIKMIRDLPKLNYLTFEKMSNDKLNNSKFYLTSNSLYNYIKNNSNYLSQFSLISNDEIILYFNWNKFTNDHLKNNPSIDPIELLAILTDDLVIPNENKFNFNNLNNLLTSIHNFILGSIAGIIGATLVYPIDIIKTRMQNQKNNSVYNSYLDCFRKLIKNEGILGLYSGLLPQIIGVAPEKAIKLVLNDLVRNYAKNNSKNGEITLNWEILAGSLAGFCQVIVTNPLEVSKIRLQTQGEYIKQLKDNGKLINSKSTIEIIRELGIKGLYRGVGACLLRDIPFSGIYFPAYANIKKYFFNLDPGKPNKRSSLEPWELLVSGALAGMPAAFLTTPCDVIKTRIQTKPNLGQKPYLGIIPTFKRIISEEGPKALFKGGIARICRSSPQFGFTLAAYEFFQKTIPLSLFYDTENSNNVSNDNKNNNISPSFSITENSKRFKLSSSASSADLNPTLLSLTNYYKSIEKDQKK